MDHINVSKSIFNISDRYRYWRKNLIVTSSKYYDLKW